MIRRKCPIADAPRQDAAEQGVKTPDPELAVGGIDGLEMLEADTSRSPYRARRIEEHPVTRRVQPSPMPSQEPLFPCRRVRRDENRDSARLQKVVDLLEIR